MYWCVCTMCKCVPCVHVPYARMSHLSLCMCVRLYIRVRACRWDDDVVFKNQARNEPKQQKRFINDTIRNDFHKRFLQRYIR